jgi:hypothetical protein
MRTRPTKIIESGRINPQDDRTYGTTSAMGCNGAFFATCPSTATRLKIIANDTTCEESEGWEHVSVSTKFRAPTWDEMHWVKEQFWDAEETVVQFHPPKSQYVNCHPYCLHLWRKVGAEYQLPPRDFVGPA